MDKTIMIRNSADPDILKAGKDYYMVLAAGEEGEVDCAFQCFHSKDLTHWSEPKIVLSLKDVSWADRMGWAPSLAKYRNRYYLCFCAEQQIGIAVSDSPWGPFRDMLDRPLISGNQYGIQSIDPSLYVENDRMYLFWGQGKCLMAELEVAEDGVSFREEPVCLSDDFYVQSSSQEAFDISIYNEAPDIFRIRDRYLLSWSIYDYRDMRYRVRYAWSDNLYGPYIQPVNEDMKVDNILVQGHGTVMGTGHACVTEYQGEYYLFYHRMVYPRKGYQREICKGKIQFLSEDKIKVVLEEEPC